MLRRSRKRGRHDPLCFHAQQCVEKYLKARLTEAGIEFPKTHDLPVLLNAVVSVEPLWSGMGRSFKALTHMGIMPRYPGMTATIDDAARSFRTCTEFRKLARERLGFAR